MRVALLVPGPSLPEVWNDARFDEYGCVVAVNGAAQKFRCHWAVGMDGKMMGPLIERQCAHAPLRGFVTKKALGVSARFRGFEHVEPAPYYGRNMPGGLAIPRTHSPDRCGYSAVNALWWANEQAAGEPPDVYGFDFAVLKDDFDGTKGDHSRARWRIEAAWLRGWWKPGTRVFGRAKLELLHYLEGRRKDWEP